MEGESANESYDNYLSLYLAWKAPVALLATFYSVLGLYALTVLSFEIMVRRQRKRKTAEQEAMFGSGRNSILDTRRSSVKLGRSGRMLTSERTTSITTESDPIMIQPVQNRERLLIQGGQGAGGSASDQLL